jgi:hypothetical protein
MKQKALFGVGILIVALLIQSCNLTSRTPAESAGGSTESATPTLVTVPATAEIIPVDLGGPTVGTSMLWVDNSIIVYVPGGEFTMGGGDDNNTEHRVSESPFWIYRSEVTNRQYALCIKAGQCFAPLDPKGVEALNDTQQRDMPVVGVTWDEAQSYCKWTQGRLPTESEWEKTARGPDGNIYPWGAAEPDCNLLNFNGCTGKTSKFNANPNGKSYYEALDLAGNVFEWVGDWYDPAYYAVSPTDDPAGPDNGTQRSVRSSSYMSFPSDVPTAKRFYLEPDKYRADLGFRCVVESPGSFAPFCESNTVYIPNDPNQTTCTPPNIGGSQTSCRNAREGVVQVNVGTGRLESFDPTLYCEQIGETVNCFGTPQTGAVVTVCNECGQSSVPTEFGCSLGYMLSSVGRACDYTPAESSVCPPGATLMQDGDILACVYPGGQSCPPNTYFDENIKQCVSWGVPGNNCLPGFSYMPELGCCQAIFQDPSYPGCNLDEIYDPKTGSCVGADAGSQTGCISFKLDTPACDRPDNPGPSCSMYTDPSSCTTNGCQWDKMTNTCRR